MRKAGGTKDSKETVWNLKKLGGWEKYKKKTDDVSDQVKNIIANENYSIDEVMKKVQKIEEKVKFAAFGKPKIKGSQQNLNKAEINGDTCNCEQVECEICHKDADKKLAVLKRQSKRMEKEVNKVKESGQGRVGQIFKMKENVGGPRKSSMNPYAIEDPKTKELTLETKSRILMLKI